jgi:ubiquinone/menaquinone biosynthesis C-methylase UbiE
VSSAWNEATIRQWSEHPCGAQYSAAEPGSPRWAEETDRFRFGGYAPWLPAWADFASSAGERVLEVGCGTGFDTARFAAAGADVTAVDLVPRSLELTSQRLSVQGLNATLVLADAHSLPFPDASFDRVYSFGVLHHLAGPERGITEMMRVLRPGGRLQLAVYHRRSGYYAAFLWLYHGVVRGMLRRMPMDRILSLMVERGGNSPDLIVRAYTKAEVRRMAAGLVSARITVHGMTVDDFPWLPGICRRVPVVAAAVRAAMRPASRLWGWYLCVDGTKPG